MDRPLRQGALYKERSTKEQFASETDPDGAAWAPLARSTLRRKKTSSILRETGSTAVSVAMVGPSGLVVRVVVGTGYAIYHQTGTTKMPQRKILGWADKDREKIAKIFERYFSV
nr:phage virion morphogenesis protein [Pseudanabaena sp. FACHB-2040]